MYIDVYSKLIKINLYFIYYLFENIKIKNKLEIVKYTILMNLEILKK